LAAVEEEELAAFNLRNTTAVVAVDADLCVFIWALRLLTLSNSLPSANQHIIKQLKDYNLIK
jgi:hypothetical protein